MESAQRVLIVEDDLQVRMLLTEYLASNGFHPTGVATAAAMRAHLRSGSPDLVLLDLGLPDGDGLSLTRELRVETDLPIIIITGRDDAVDRVVGLELGADDYVGKPFENRELLARIRSVLRRYQKAAQALPAVFGDDAEVLEFEGWRLDRKRYRLTNPAGEDVELTSHEFHLLDILASNAHHVLSRARILELSSDREWMPYDRSVDVAIAKLRKKLERDPANPRLIKTVRNAGYLFTGGVARNRD